MASVRPPARPLKSSVTERVVEALSLCLPTRSSFTPTTEKCRQQQQQRFDGFQLTLSCKRSAEMMALNRRVAHSLDLEQIFAWQTELEVYYHEAVIYHFCSRVITARTTVVLPVVRHLLRRDETMSHVIGFIAHPHRYRFWSD